jgi:hypothetical protein
MKNVREDLAASYGKLSEGKQALFLARILLRLNLLARGTYSVGEGVNDPNMLRKFNEAQNRIEAQLLSLLQSNPKRYPDDVFSNILIDQFEWLGMSSSAAVDMINYGSSTHNPD